MVSIDILQRGYLFETAKTLNQFRKSVLSALISLLMLVTYLVIMSGVLANSNENDTFLKSLYFYTITMTTVGLGDIAVIGRLVS